MNHGYVDLAWIKEANGCGVYEAPAWSVQDGDIVDVKIPGVYGGRKECHVKAYVTTAKNSAEYEFIKAIFGGKIEKIKRLYHEINLGVEE